MTHPCNLVLQAGYVTCQKHVQVVRKRHVNCLTKAAKGDCVNSAVHVGDEDLPKQFGFAEVCQTIKDEK